MSIMTDEGCAISDKPPATLSRASTWSSTRSQPLGVILHETCAASSGSVPKQHVHVPTHVIVHMIDAAAQCMCMCMCMCMWHVHVNMHVRVMHMRTWLACSTCLTANLAQEIEELRAVQMAQLLVALEARAAALADGVLLCGDFNTDPYDLPTMCARCVPAVLRHPLGLRSAYPLPEDARSRWWTTWKKRGEHEVRRAVGHAPPYTPLHPALAPRPCRSSTRSTTSSTTPACVPRASSRRRRRRSLSRRACPGCATRPTT